MQKKGDISLETIIVAALVLFVLVIVIAIFSGQIKEYAKGFWGIGKEAEWEARGLRCVTIMGTRGCYENCLTGYEEVPEPADKWKDCNTAKGQKCCEKIPKEKEE